MEGKNKLREEKLRDSLEHFLVKHERDYFNTNRRSLKTMCFIKLRGAAAACVSLDCGYSVGGKCL